MREDATWTLFVLIMVAAFCCPAMSAQEGSKDEQSTDEHGSKSDSTPPPINKRADGVYVESLRADKVAGKASSDGFVDIYIYGPNNGNPRDVSNARVWGGPGRLVFHRNHVLVKNREWSTAISPALPSERSYFYKINVNQTAEQGLTESEHAQDNLDFQSK